MVSIDLPGVWIVLQRVHLLPRLMRLGYVSSRTSLVAVGGNRFGVRVQQTELSKSLNVISSRFGLTGSGWRTLAVPVADRWDGPPAYFLVLFTQNKQGLWYFANAASYGADVLHDFTFRNDPQPKLLMPEDAENWVGQIERNVRELIDRYGSFRPIDYVTEVYGNTLGRAREKHIREALNNLYQQGQTSSSPRGVQDLHSMQVSAHRQ